MFDHPRNRQKLTNRHDKHILYARPLRNISCLISKESVKNCELWNLLKKSLRTKLTNKQDYPRTMNRLVKRKKFVMLKHRNCPFIIVGWRWGIDVFRSNELTHCYKKEMSRMASWMASRTTSRMHPDCHPECHSERYLEWHQSWRPKWRPDGILNGIPNGTLNGIPIGILNSILKGITNCISNGIQIGLPNGVSNGIPNGVPHGVQNGVPNDVLHGVLNGVPILAIYFRAESLSFKITLLYNKSTITVIYRYRTLS